MFKTPLATLNRQPTDPVDTVLPDCCNASTVLRVLLAVNAAVLAALFLTSEGLPGSMIRFVELSFWVEPVCLSTLVVLCCVGRFFTRIKPWRQRLICIATPMLITALLMRLLARFTWFGASFPNLYALKAVLAAALFGAVLQHYFELRGKAHSPALGEARLQALQARIRPHFLFNSLNAVLSLIRSEPRRAESALEDRSGRPVPRPDAGYA